MSHPTRLLTTFALLIAAVALTASPALARKHDRDRLPDRWEKRHHLNLKQDDSRRDRDRDGLSNYGEYRAHTNPRKKDSDRDGRRDSREDFDRDHLRNAAEIRTGFDPGDADSDDDGVKDGRENAGTITRLSDTSVTIRLAVGGSLTAQLGDDLVLDCAPGTPGSGSGSAPDPDVPEPGEDDPEAGEDAPAGEDAEDTADGANAPDWDEDASDAPDFEEDAPLAARASSGDACDATALKVGALVHKAKVDQTASGAVLIYIRLVGTTK